jgi:hypothetical protein
MDQSELANHSTANLVKLATEQMRDLVRDELVLAKSEMAEKGKQVGVGAGLFGGAAVLGFYGVGVLLAAITLALALVLPDWAAALIVALLIFAVAGLLALLGRNRISRGTPAAPAGAIRNVRADLDAVSSAIRRQPTVLPSATNPAIGPSADSPAMKPTARTQAATGPAGTRPTAARPTAARPTGTRPTAARPTGTRPTAARPEGGRTAPTRNEWQA